MGLQHAKSRKLTQKLINYPFVLALLSGREDRTVSWLQL